MDTGAIALADLEGGFDLQTTLECGQSYCWTRADDQAYKDEGVHGGTAWYTTVVPADGVDPADEHEVLRVRRADGVVEWEATTDARPLLDRLLRLDDDLDAITARTPDDSLLARAYDRYRGLRLVRDPPFASLISFICSAQMRVVRIYRMQRALAREFGDQVKFDGRTYDAFPTPDRLASAAESELRNLGLGYRAPYVKRTAELVSEGVVHPEEARGLPYEEAREYLTQFVGVGNKVADCVLLFSLGYLEAVPIDTWIRTAIAEHYPECDRGSYAETSRAIRAAFGGEYAGYTQTYVFNYLRSGGE